MKQLKLDYGGPGIHVSINKAFGVILLVIAVLGTIFLHPSMFLISFPAIYFIYNAMMWKKGSMLEERIRMREILIKFVQPKDGDKILDVGTGGGLLAIGFAKAIKSEEIVGIDIWMKGGGGTTLERAKRNAEIEGVSGQVKFEEGDARNIPYPDNYFDIVVASTVIHVIWKDKDKAFQEMIRVLKLGGKFAIIEPPTGFKWSVDAKLKEKLNKMGLENIKFEPFRVSYPKRRQMYIIYGEKR